MKFESIRSTSILAVVAAIGLFLASACGFGDSRSIKQFSGTWEWDDGSSSQFNCDGSSGSDSLSGNLSINEGAGADLLVSSPNCNWEFDVNGDDASIVSGQTCEYESVSNGQQVEVTENYSTYMLSRSDDNNMTVTANGTFEVEFSSGGQVECSQSINGSLTKVGS